jgi:ABC-type polysaccharide/polyol phosphate transport system ATPase subunit
MSAPAAIEAQDLGKRYYRRGHAPPTLFGSLRHLFSPRPRQEFWALRHATFTVPRGCTVGVVGPNGAGKSSTLGLVAGTITPTEGTVRAHGRISSLLELGAGFHPDLTGRENVFLNGALLGIPREDIARKYDAIVDFAGLGEFMDMPVRHYSSGMYVRLGFAVATEVDPDILLIDEVLAVGDVAFQLKCLDRIRRFQRRGKTLLFVSHALQTVEEFCDEAWLVHHGELAEQGPPGEVILKYIRGYMGEGGGVFSQEFGTREVEFGEVALRDGQGALSASFTAGQPLHVDISFLARQPVERPVFGYSIKTANGQFLYGTNTQVQGVEIPRISGAGRVRLTLDPLLLRQGQYLLSLAIHSWDHATQYHRREDWYPFKVANEDAALGPFRLGGVWTPPMAG